MDCTTKTEAASGSSSLRKENPGVQSMSGDKHHFGFLVKDDIKRFFYQAQPFSTVPPSTHSYWDSSGQRDYLLTIGDFQPSPIFQRYPDILVLKSVIYQQFNKNI